MGGEQKYEAHGVTDLACNKWSVDGVPLWFTCFDVWGDRARPPLGNRWLGAEQTATLLWTPTSVFLVR